MGQVNFSHQIDDEKCDYVIIMIIIVIIKNNNDRSRQLINLMHKFFFYNKFIIFLYMFRALCAHHQEVKLYYTTSGIITLVGGRSTATYRV